MSLPSDKAEEILELCLSKESPQMREKVYEVISLSGIRANDPMFLVLALTGQIRVLLEVAPSELRELLNAWKGDLSRSMKELQEAISQLRAAQEMQIETLKQSCEEINFKNVNNIRELHQSLVGELLEANTEVEENIQQSVSEVAKAREELIELNKMLRRERSTNVKVMKSLIEGLDKTTKDFELANNQIYSSIATLDRLKLSKFVNRWMFLASLVTAAIFASLLTFGILSYKAD